MTSGKEKLALNRRQFLSVSTGVVFSFAIPISARAKTGETNLSITAWVKLDTNNKITIMSPAAEMGQGSMTAVPMIFAEEFDVDWDDVSLEFSPSDDANFKNPTRWVHGIMLTLGSSSVSGYYDAARLLGAQARKIIMLAAARHWMVPLDQLHTEAGTVIHKATSRRLTYGETIGFIRSADALPEVAEAELKAEEDFRIIGSDLPRYDIPEKVTGRALYSIDVNVPGMVFATVLHSPVKGGTPLSVKNQKQIEKRLNVLRIIKLADAVAVVARSYEAAYLAEKELDITWTQVDKLASYSDSKGLDEHLRLVRDTSVKGMPIQKKGDMDSALKKADKTFHAEYLSDYLYHAQMEPLNAVANVSVEGQSVDVWAGTQAPTHCVRSIAADLGIDVSKVNLHRTYLGGGFGRRGAQDQDYVIDAVQLSRQMKLPVKVIWSRESDVKTGRFKPIKAMSMRAGEDANGKLVAWHHRTASDEAMKQADPYRHEKNGGWPVISSGGMDIDYDIENITAEMLDPDTGTRAAPLRGIGGTINKFASESFLDEIALDKKVDPLDLRLQLLHKHPVALKVLNRVAEMSDWRNRKPGDGMGMAFDSAYYPTAYVVQVAVDKNTGVIRVAKVWVALDVGIAIHPRNIFGQMEGQIIFAISNVLKERITMTNGVVDQSNFHDYPIMRMSEIPEIEITVLTRKHSKPLGVGDSRLGPIPAAVGNAFTNLTGKRLRHLPLIPSRVTAILKA
ncbi:MAG: isoquinoline 1-oxidoreductase beta subunit [Gammaproteobacteria bacterium]